MGETHAQLSRISLSFFIKIHLDEVLGSPSKYVFLLLTSVSTKVAPTGQRLGDL
jgi:hypothetical protein